MMRGHGGIPGSRSQKDGVLELDILLAASERSVQVETFWEVAWIFWMAWWGIDGLRLVGELRVCALLCLCLGVLILDDLRQGGSILWCAFL